MSDHPDGDVGVVVALGREFERVIERDSARPPRRRPQPRRRMVAVV